MAEHLTPPLTPIMRQYQTIKAQHVGCLVMFRMGDFYEMLGADAEVASALLSITLTRRRTAKEGDEGVPMCGVPYHAAESYIGKLVAAGHKVALVEQVETPEEAKAARGSGALVRREVVRLFTPGTLTEDSLLSPTTPRVLVAVAPEPEQPDNTPPELWRGALAWLDLSTGETAVRPVSGNTLHSALSALSIGEAVAHPSLEHTLVGLLPRRLVNVQPQLFALPTAEGVLHRAYGVALASLGLPGPAAVCALGAVVGYAELTQLGKLPTLKIPSLPTPGSRMALDAATRRNLELTESLTGTRTGSLLACLDATCTAAGARLLARWLHEPLTDLSTLQARQAAVQALAPVVGAVQAALKNTTDLARAASRLTLGRGGPRDVASVLATARAAPELAKLLAPLTSAVVAELAAKLPGLAVLEKTLTAALLPENLPLLARDGGFIRAGYDAELDRLQGLLSGATTLLHQLEKNAQSHSGISTLKVRYNKVWGYYYEVPGAQAGKLPAHFMHRQTTTNSQRFTCPELLKLERELTTAGASALKRELDIFEDLVAQIKAHSLAILDAAEALATLDVLASAASFVGRPGWVLPTLTNAPELQVEAGRHPVVAAAVAARGEAFVANSAHLHPASSLALITGPNMAGKSTFLRQNAVIVLLAQIGHPVPAASATVGLADAIFCRLGATDNLAAGQSTFMVEMVEAAHILNRATEKSLVVLDEIGRGTATYDGLALAWAMAEDLAARRTRTLFATHYHELTALAASARGPLENVALLRAAVKEWKNEVVFLHSIEPGAAPGSFGIQVARLAGVPPKVLQRAESLLTGFLKSSGQLRNDGRGGLKGVARLDELALFAAPVAPTAKPQTSELEARLAGLNLDDLSPRQALAELYELRQLAQH